MTPGLLNNIEAMDSLVNEIIVCRREAITFHNELMSYIRDCRDKGYLDEENYDQLVSLFLGNYFETDFNGAFEVSTNKMINYLTALRNKVQEYMNISD